jgi:hypothetical protein
MDDAREVFNSGFWIYDPVERVGGRFAIYAMDAARMQTTLEVNVTRRLTTAATKLECAGLKLASRPGPLCAALCRFLLG